eukprot:3600708-Lingulodinium_polyedra.AAC.1
MDMADHTFIPLVDVKFVCREQNDRSQGRCCWLSMHFNMMAIPAKKIEKVKRDIQKLNSNPGKAVEWLMS